MSTQIELPEITQQMGKRQPTIMDLLDYAVRNNGAIDVIERLGAMEEKAQARDAETEFNLAMNAVQSELGRIAPDANNPQTKSKYATYSKLDGIIRPIYIKHGFSLSFDSGDSPSPETVVAYCYVSHRAGHTRKYQSPPMPADGKGAKGGDVMTKTHATGAAMSYAMRYLLKFIFNIAVGEDDTDGNAPMSGADVDVLQEWIDSIEGSSTFEELQQKFTEAYRANTNQTARDAIIAAKDRHKKKLLAKAKGAQ